MIRKSVTNLIEKNLLLANHLVYSHVRMYVSASNLRTYYVCVSPRTHANDVHEGFAPCKGEQDVHRMTLDGGDRRRRIHFRGKIKFRWVVGFSRVLSYFIIHEGTFLPVNSLARSSASDTADGVSSNFPRVALAALDRFLALSLSPGYTSNISN